ncbi:MAG: hemolysin family protein [Gemmatimonadota bacterium]|nr:hemolysin family protein [Gemmatimonadota bacterium]
MTTALMLLAVVLLVLANAFFVAAEFALVTARQSRIEEKADRGDRMAQQVLKAQQDLDRSVSGTQLGITLASLGLGWIGEPAVASLIESSFSGLSAPFSTIATHATAVAIAFSLITFLHIVLGELAPKSLALRQPEMVGRWVAGPLNVFNLIASPAIYVLNGAAQFVLRVLGRGDLTTGERVHSPDEIEFLLRKSSAEGLVELDEEAMIHGVFELTRTIAREVMTPRPDIVGLPVQTGLDEILKTAVETGLSRFPVYRETIDDIAGVLLVKDLLPWVSNPETAGEFRLDRVMRPPFFVPDSKPVAGLLAEFRREKVHIAIVVDEFGGTDGIMTLEDLVEEIVGDIFDEHDVAELEFEALGGGRVSVDGGAALEDLLDKFEVRDVEGQDEYDTVAGYVIGRLGRIPSAGDHVELGNASLEVIETNDQRVTRLELRLPGSVVWEPEESEPAIDGEGNSR